MAQPGTERTNFGWGDLKPELDKLVSFHQKLEEDKVRVLAGEEYLRNRIVEINESRQKRAIALLKSKKLAICLTHSLVFLGTQLLVLRSDEEVAIVQINKSWTTEYSIAYNEGVPYTQEYETIACEKCQGVLSHGRVVSFNKSTHQMAGHQKPSTASFERFYSLEILNRVSSEYFGMPVVTLEMLKSQ